MSNLFHPMTAAPIGCLDGEQAIRDALAAGPTPGPWFTISRGQYWHEEEADVLRSDGEDLVQAEFVKPVGDVPTTRGQMYMRDAEYIAACNPETMRALLAELDRLRSASRQEGWQAIETAPKDKSEFLALYGRQGNVMQIIRWNAIHGFWQCKGEPENGFSSNATHWRPLPALPQEAQGDRHGE